MPTLLIARLHAPVSVVATLLAPESRTKFWLFEAFPVAPQLNDPVPQVTPAVKLTVVDDPEPFRPRPVHVAESPA